MLNDTAPNTDNKVICVSLPSIVADKLDTAASNEMRSRSNLVAKIVTEYFEVKE